MALEFHWAWGQSDRLRALAADLVRRQVALIATSGTVSSLAAKAATTTIPIVFSTAADPIAVGLVESLNRPGGNATGVANLNVELGPKQLELLHELLPTATPGGIPARTRTIGMVGGPEHPHRHSLCAGPQRRSSA